MADVEVVLVEAEELALELREPVEALGAVLADLSTEVAFDVFGALAFGSAGD
ncbi:MAG: hypothetical protein AAGA96_17325 [Verrucomicrobiota bacterium]